MENYNVSLLLFLCGRCQKRNPGMRPGKGNCLDCHLKYILMTQKVDIQPRPLEDILALCQDCLMNSVYDNCSCCQDKKNIVSKLRNIENEIDSIGFNNDMIRTNQYELICKFRSLCNDLSKL